MTRQQRFWRTVLLAKRSGGVRYWLIGLVLVIVVAGLLLAFLAAGLFSGRHGVLAGILDRLDSKSLGDYAAIVAETALNEDGTQHERPSAINLYAQNGRSSLWCRYIVGDPSSADAKGLSVSVLSMPAGWPKPKLEDVLTQVKDRLPSEYYVTDGSRVWPVQKGSRRDLVDVIWPNRRRLLLGKRFAGTPRPSATLVTDAEHPGLIGIHAEGQILVRDRVFQRIEQLCWIDPNRSDVPIETMSRDYEPDGKMVQLEFVTKYTSHAQLSDHTWYPSQWQVTTQMKERGKQYDRRYHLQLFDGMKLDPSWFVDPKERSKSK